jgi:hypothetical protein
MALTGLVHEVVTEDVATSLAGDHTAGAGVVNVVNAAQFPQLGGTIRLEDISTGTLVTEDIDYTNADGTPDNQLDVTGTLVNSYPDGSIVTLISPARPTTTVFVTTDPASPPIPAVAPQEMVVVHAVALAEGPRDEGMGAPVLIEEIGDEYRVTKVLAAPAVDGPSIVGDVPNDALPPGTGSDGDAPTVTPVVTGQPFGVGAVEFTWPAVSNPDPIRAYDYWTSLTTPVDTSGDPTGFVVQPNLRVSRVGDVQVPMDGVGEVYIVVAARDADGRGPLSTEVGVIPRKPDVDAITAILVAALEIEASQITGEFISADLALLTKLKVGGFLDINGDDSTIIIYSDTLDSMGNRVPLIRLDPTGSSFRGAIIADDISVLNGLILQGAFSQIANDAVVTLMNGIADPATAPDVTVGWEQLNSLAAVPSGYVLAGTTDHATAGYISRLLFKTSGKLGYVQVINTATGAQVSLTALGNVTGFTEDMFSGIVRFGSYYYVGVLDINAGGGADDIFYLAKFDTATCGYIAKLQLGGTFAGFTQDRTVDAIRLGVNYTDSLIYFNQSDGSAFYAIDVATFADTGDYTSPNDAGHSFTTYRSFMVGSFDFGSKTWLGVMDGPSYAIVASSTTSKATMDIAGARAWPALTNAEVFWHVTDGRFYMVSARSNTATHYRFGAYNATETWWVSYQHINGANHTKSSPQKSVVVNPRQIPLAVASPYPSGVVGAKFYVGYGGTAPAVAARYARAESVTGSRTSLLTVGHQTSGANPTETNTFGAGGPGKLLSQVGGLSMGGDGSFAAPLQDNRVALPTLANSTTTTETIVVQQLMAAGYFKAGMMDELVFNSIQSGSSTLQWKVYIGPLGTTADPVRTFTTTGAGAANAHQLGRVILACLTAGAGGTLGVDGIITHGGAISDAVGAIAASSPVSVDTTVANYVTVTVKQGTSSQTVTMRAATITKLRG